MVKWLMAASSEDKRVSASGTAGAPGTLEGLLPGMSSSRRGEEGARFEWGEAGALSEASEPEAPNLAILTG